MVALQLLTSVSPTCILGFTVTATPGKDGFHCITQLQLKYETQKMVERSFLVSLESGSLWPCWSCSIGAAGTHKTKDIKSIQSTHVCITRRESCSYVVIQMEQSKISIGLMYSATGTCSHHRAVLNWSTPVHHTCTDHFCSQSPHLQDKESSQLALLGQTQ